MLLCYFIGTIFVYQLLINLNVAKFNNLKLNIA